MRLFPPIAALVAVTAAGLVAAGCDAALQTGLPEEQADRVLVALHEEGIGASKERDGPRGEPSFEIRVAQDDVAHALAVLRARDLPRSTDPGFEEVFGQGSLVPTPSEEQGRYAAALAGELARSIESIDGVLDARVHVALPDGRDFVLDESRPRPRASVLVKHHDGPVPVDDDALQALVAGAVEDLRAQDVSVVRVAAPQAPHEGTEPLVAVGPVWVARSSAGTLRALLGFVALAGMCAAAGLVILLRRQRRRVRSAGPATNATP
ncbi:MAG: secretion protein [Myxococcota bacterium]